MGSTVTASNGVQLPIDSLPIAIAWSGSFVNTMTTFYAGVTYVQTFTNNSTDITNISNWVAQPITPVYLIDESTDYQLISEIGENLIQENT